MDSEYFMDFAPVPLNSGFKMPEYWIWGGSGIKGEDAKYHLFASRWPRKYPFFNSYTTHSEIVRAESDSPFGPFVFKEVVLSPRGEQFWDGRMTHNPSIHQYKDRFLLFFIGSTFRGRQPSRDELLNNSPKCSESYRNIKIGLAVSNSVHGPWERLDEPILQPRTGKWDSSVVTNPAPCILPDGKILLIYRSNTREGTRLGIAMADHYHAPFRILRDTPIPDLVEVEDPFVWWNGKIFELIAKDISGRICGEKGAGMYSFSNNGIDWKFKKFPRAYSRCILWTDGKKTVQGCLERPQLLIEDFQLKCLFAATSDGTGGFENCKKTWNLAIPLKNNFSLIESIT